MSNQFFQHRFGAFHRKFLLHRRIARPAGRDRCARSTTAAAAPAALPKFTAVRRASPRVGSLAADRHAGSSPARMVADDEAGDVHPSWPLPGCRIKWVCHCVTYNFPSEKMARPSQRACLVATEHDDVFGLECDNEVPAIAPNGYLPAKRVKDPSGHVLAKH